MVDVKPIIFRGDMVRAVREGRKTQTRRVMKMQEPCARFGKQIGWPAPGECWVPTSNSGKVGIFRKNFHRCPYGKPGDRLWVRETWKYDDWTEDGEPFIVYADDAELRGPIVDIPDEWQDRVADTFAALSVDYKRKGRACDEHWRPSIYMPRWACRIMLEVLSVRVERVQEITAADAFAEGIGLQWDSPILAFSKLWDSINEKRGFGWDANPWVWAVEFRVLEVCDG